MKNIIDYIKIAQAIEHYKSAGFKYLNVDWAVKPESVRITTPPHCRIHKLNSKALVGSAEQSFLHMMMFENLQPDRYVAATPCFRDDMVDDLHSTYFFKVELIDFLNVESDYQTKQSLNAIIEMCQIFFEKFLKTEIVQTEDLNWDIVDAEHGIELGSYGIRSHERYKWIYATGIAEPRLSTVISHQYRPIVK